LQKAEVAKTNPMSKDEEERTDAGSLGL
jgi:hypothetical protein